MSDSGSNDWLPIETAPRDGGRRILGYFPDQPEWYQYSVICWSQGHSNWWACSVSGSGVCDTGQPTHWQPLPAPPATPPEGE